jgi:hypothetical protein
MPAKQGTGSAPFAWILSFVLFASASPAQSPTENQVKAAFLLNFTKFVDWPPGAFADTSSPLTICIFGDDPFGNALDEIVQGETVNGRKIQTRRLRDIPPPHTCQVAYLGSAFRDNARLLRGLGSGVLTVGEGDAFVRDGGIIGFVVENRKVRFDVNRIAAESADLKLSSRLLSVARVVKE